jgi:hypothetical protein
LQYLQKGSEIKSPGVIKIRRGASRLGVLADNISQNASEAHLQELEAMTHGTEKKIIKGPVHKKDFNTVAFVHAFCPECSHVTDVSSRQAERQIEDYGAIQCLGCLKRVTEIWSEERHSEWKTEQKKKPFPKTNQVR